MQSISGMPCDELAGIAMRYVPIPEGMPCNELAGIAMRCVPIHKGNAL